MTRKVRIKDKNKIFRICKGKVKYHSFAMVTAVVEKIKKRRKKEIYFYHCPICEKFHLTSKK
jgi:hypothetical protein